MAQGQAQGQAMSPAFMIGLMLMVLAGFSWGVWMLMHGPISYWILYAKWIEAIPFAWIPGPRFLVERMISYAPRSAHLEFLELMIAIYPTSLLYTPIALYFGYRFSKTAYSHPLRKAKRLHTAQSLMEAQVKSFSAIAPILDRDLTRENPPEWRSSEDPDLFAKKNRLVRSDATLDRERAEIVFVDHLGRLHDNDPRKWKPHEQAMFSLFCEAVFEPEDGFSNAEMLIDVLNYSAKYRNGKHVPNFSLATKLYQKWLPRIHTHEDLKDMMTRHRYVRTLIYALMMETTDEGFYEHTNKGVMNSGQFIWLKPVDRQLWYPLNTVGRKTPFLESTAVFTQFGCEMTAWKNAHVLVEPHLHNGVVAWEEELFRCGLVLKDPRKIMTDSYDVHE
ncbi:MAG: hypothetical protein Q7K26_02020 [bacterium]|nr:hypothetical protein [bacterium]